MSEAPAIVYLVDDTQEPNSPEIEMGGPLDPGGGPEGEGLIGIYDGEESEPLTDEQLSLDDGLNE